MFLFFPFTAQVTVLVVRVWFGNPLMETVVLLDALQAVTTLSEDVHLVHTAVRDLHSFSSAFETVEIAGVCPIAGVKVLLNTNDLVLTSP